MGRPKRTKVAVLYNQLGEDQYEALRQKVKEGEVVSPTGDIKDLEGIATVREEIGAIVKALKGEGFDARAVNIEDDFGRLLVALNSPRPDVVFNLIEFFNDDPLLEDRIPALYDLLRLPYTGSPPMTLAICQRKGLTKQILKAFNIPTPRYKLVKHRPVPKLTGLRYPLIVKPAWEDASAGVTEQAVVEDRAQLEKQVLSTLAEYHQPALVEEYIEGRELGISVIGNKNARMLPIEEMDFSELPPENRRIITFASKWEPLRDEFHQGKLVCPAKLSRSVQQKVRKAALRTYQVMGCRDYARVDMRLDKDDNLFVLEVNPNPDLTEGVAFMASVKAAGLTFSAGLRMIVE
ncbi:MAG: ATP-grasp domain-containing protein, partial [Candidatus Aminicenantes bacterium]|nr:ATP-grasp domain-containing protein [Candidatus Aminicenantes bacterium]